MKSKQPNSIASWQYWENAPLSVQVAGAVLAIAAVQAARRDTHVAMAAVLIAGALVVTGMWGDGRRKSAPVRLSRRRVQKNRARQQRRMLTTEGPEGYIEDRRIPWGDWGVPLPPPSPVYKPQTIGAIDAFHFAPRMDGNPSNAAPPIVPDDAWVTADDLGNDPVGVLARKKPQDGVASALVDAQSRMRPIDVRVLPEPEVRGDGFFDIGFQLRGMLPAPFKSPNVMPMAFTHATPDIVPHRPGEYADEALASSAARVVHAGASKPLWSGVGGGGKDHIRIRGRPRVDSAPTLTKATPASRMMLHNSTRVPTVRTGAARPPTTSLPVVEQPWRHAAPAGPGHVRPNTMRHVGMDVPPHGRAIGPDRDGLMLAPNAVNTAPILVARDAAAKGISDPYNPSARDLVPSTDAWGFRFADKYDSKHAEPDFYPARGYSDWLLYEQAAQYAPDINADIMDRAVLAGAEFIEPLNARYGMMKLIAADMTHMHDPYSIPRTGPSVMHPGRKAIQPWWYKASG